MDQRKCTILVYEVRKTVVFLIWVLFIFKINFVYKFVFKGAWDLLWHVSWEYIRNTGSVLATRLIANQLQLHLICNRSAHAANLSLAASVSCMHTLLCRGEMMEILIVLCAIFCDAASPLFSCGAVKRVVERFKRKTWKFTLTATKKRLACSAPTSIRIDGREKGEQRALAETCQKRRVLLLNLSWWIFARAKKLRHRFVADVLTFLDQKNAYSPWWWGGRIFELKNVQLTFYIYFFK